jgi:hypothetical protein
MAVRDGNAVVFQGWNGGEYGDLDAAVAGRNPRQMFTAKNMMLYRNGLIGPRPGLKALTLSSAPSGTICGMDSLAVGDGTGPWFWVATQATGAVNVYQAKIGSGSFSGAYTGTAAGLTGVTRPIPVGGSYGSGALLNIYEKGIYSLAHAAVQTFDPVSTILGGGTTIGFNSTRFLLNGSDGSLATGDSRLYYSDVFPGWGTFGASEYYDFGAYNITMVRPFRDGFLVGNNVGEMWYATGVIGDATFTVRRVTKGGAPAFESRGCILKANQAVYMNPNCSYPSTFNGAEHNDWKHLKFTGNVAADDNGVTPGFRVLPMPWGGGDDYAIFSGQTGSGAANRALLYTNGVHTYHEFGVNTSAWVVCMGDAVATNNQDETYFVIAGSGGYYKWAPSVPDGTDRPGYASDTDAQPGDNSTTPFDAYLHTPIHTIGEGRTARVQQVIIDYIAYNTGAANNCRMDVTVDAHYRHVGDAVSSSSTLTVLDSAPSSFTTAGVRRRAVAMVGDQGAGGGFQVKLSNVRGVAVEKLTVVLADEDVRP